MSAVDILRDALFGNPPSPSYKPSREGVLAAFTEMNYLVTAAVSGAAAGLRYYATRSAMSADTSQPLGTLAYVYADPTAANNTVYHYETGGWVVDGAYFEGVASVVQPLLDAQSAMVDGYADRAEAAAVSAEKSYSSFFFGTDIALALGVDADGYVSSWLDKDGVLHAAFDGGSFDVFTSGVAFGTVDSEGYVANAVSASGKPYYVDTPFAVAVTGAAGSRDILLTSAAGSAYLTYTEGDSTAPTVQDDQIAWLRGSTLKSRDISARAIVAGGVTNVAMIAGYGQSNSIGGDLGPIGLDRVPLDPGRALMFSGGIVPARYGELVSEADLGQMVDLSGPARDNAPAVGPRLVHGYIGAIPATQAVAYASSGVRGLRYDQLKPGSPFWANLIRTIVVAKLQAWRAGLSFTADAMVYIQGESDFTTATTASYKANLNEMRDAFRVAVRGITFSTTAAPPILIVQPSSWTANAYQLTTAQVPLGQMAAMASDTASFAVVGPMYPLTHMADGLHPDAEGQRRMDEMVGDGLARMARGAGASGLYVTSATRSGATVTATCRMPEGGALVIDTTRVTDPGQLGLIYRKTDGSNVAINNISVSGANITLTLAQAIGGSLRFALDGTANQPAGPTTGPRCCIRDSFGAASANGQARYNWMLHHAVDVA